MDLTPSFVMEFERRMRSITELEYFRRLIAKNVWWNKASRTVEIEGKTERIAWLLSTATISPAGLTGDGIMEFEGLVAQTVEYPTMHHAKGIRVNKDQIEDLDGTGLDLLAKWSADIGNEIAYYPQRLMAQLLLNGANTDGSANAYDGVPFFADNSNKHPYNPFRPGLGGYANWLHGSSAGSYPGALAIDDVNATTVDTALQNLGKAIAYIASVKMPNGIDPRFLTPVAIIAPPRMAPRLRELTKAKYIAQAAGASGGGAADVEALITGWGLGEPIIAQELTGNTTYSAQFAVQNSTSGLTTLFSETLTGSDSTYYIVCQENMSTQLGGLLYVLRKPFKVTYYTGEGGGTGVDAILDRANELEYHVKGRMSAQYGHPYAIFRVDGT